MEFENIKDALDTLLETNAAGRFAVLGTRKRSHDAEVVHNRAQVTTYYANGDFPKSGGSYGGPFQHDVILKIEFLVSAAARADLAILNNPQATAPQLTAALAASTDATAEADAALDALVSTVWNIIMSPENSKLGLSYNPQRWITGFQKNDPSPKGALVLLSGSMTMIASVLEYPTPEVGVPGVSVDTTVKLTADVSGETLDTAAQGVKEGA
ncbi:MAG: hypothetical protein KKB59_10525 [Spirochaetes bacterium]|nr:hypothetical protein [Spirochaetota bacterium]